MTVSFDRDIIGELRTRVVLHNNVVSDPERQVRLGEVKGLYKRFHNGPNPRAHALTEIDKCLTELRLGKLEKARQPFNQGRHPRGRAGQFRSTGGRPPTGGGPRTPAPTEPDDDPLLEAAGTQVIPETRYSMFGPPIAGAAGLAAGAVSGAGATFHGLPDWATRRGGPGNVRGNIPDRLTTGALRWAGGKLGDLGGYTAGQLVVAAPRAATRSAVGAINRRLGTAFTSPSVTGDAAGIATLRAAGTRVGRIAGAATGHVSALSVNALPAAARLVVGRVAGGRWEIGAGTPRARLAGSALGAIVGGLTTGAYVYEPWAKKTQAQVGPYEDTLFPRRVRKLAGPLFDAPEVLAKQAELMAIGLDDDVLAKASISGIAANVIRRLRPAAIAPAIEEGTSPATRAAVGSLRSRMAQFTVGRHLTGRGLTIASRVGTGAAVGVGAGAISGAALGLFNEKHPRGTHGRFARKGSGSIAGAKIGAGIGAAVGLGFGLAAARRGQTALLGAALGRLRGTVPASEALILKPTSGHPAAAPVFEANIPEAMRTEARKVAQAAHAKAYVNANKAKKIPPFGPSGSEPQHVARSLKTQAIEKWMLDEGVALQGGAKSWYRHQLDQTFDKTLRTQMRRIEPTPAEFAEAFDKARAELGPDALSEKADAALRAKVWTGLRAIPMKDGRPVTNATTNLINNVDVEALSPGRKIIWDDGVARRQATLTEIDQIYTKRMATTAELATEKATLSTETSLLTDAIKDVPDEWQDVRQDGRMPELRTFAREKMGYELPSTVRTRDSAILAIDNHIPVWRASARQRLTEISERLDPNSDTSIEGPLNEARNAETADLTGDDNVTNPFATGKNRFFIPRPAGSNTTAGFAKIQSDIGDKAAKPFLDESKAHADEAEAHLTSLIASHAAALEARIPAAGAIKNTMDEIAPVLAGRMYQGLADYRALNAAGRTTLMGWQKTLSNWVHDNTTNPAQAWATAKSVSSWASAKGKESGLFALRNWKTVAGVVGPLTAIGAIDVSGPSGKRYNLNPKRWRMPRDIGYVHEYPDSIRRPDELIAGLSFRGADGNRKFLQGIHIHSKEGAFHNLPFGADVQDVRNAVRGGSGARGVTAAPDPVVVPNQAQTGRALADLRKDGHINENAGPTGFEFAQRKGGNPGKLEAEFAEAFYKKAGLRNPGERFMAHPTKHASFYWSSLKSLFEDKDAAILDNAARARLLVGNHIAIPSTPQGQKELANTGPGRRGIFGNNRNVFKQPQDANKAEVTAAVIAHFTMNGLVPGNVDEYTQLRRAVAVVSQYYSLTPEQTRGMVASLDEAYHGASGQSPPTSKAPIVDTTAGEETIFGDASGSSEEADRKAFARSLVPDPIHRRAGLDRRDTETLVDLVEGQYDFHHRTFVQANPNASNAQAKRHAEQATRAWVNDNLLKSESVGELGKLFQPRQPRAGAPSTTPPITGAALSAATPAPPMPTASPIARLPPITGAATLPSPRAIAPSPVRAPSIGAQVKGAVAPAHALSQIGSYGLSQAGWSATNALVHGVIPGQVKSVTGRAAGTATRGVLGNVSGDLTAMTLGDAAGDAAKGIARFVLPGGAAIAGNLVGQTAGTAAGRALGDKSTAPPQTTGIATAHALGGMAGQMGAGYAIPSIMRAAGAAKNLTAAASKAGGFAGWGAKAAGTAATMGEGAEGATVASEAIPAIAGAASIGVGAEAGAAAGTTLDAVLGPFGTAGGALVGAGTVLAGTLAGYLSDEGAGILANHLSKYGKHVPAAVAGAVSRKRPPAARVAA